ncbi:MAG: YbaK/EbsC family protein [Deltaproteobacteria bacterium]|nr:YbaK/EbsC family protein [Deltaproteobacteria bacterium]
MKTLTGKERLETFLRDAGAQFETHTHSPAYTAQEVAEVEHVPGITVAKVVMVMADGELAMMVLPAPYRLDTKKTAAVVGVRDVRLATEEEFSPAFPGLDVGAMPPFGDFCNVPTYVDESLAEDDYIVFQAATHTDAMRMKYADYARVAQPIIADIAVHG